MELKETDSNQAKKDYENKRIKLISEKQDQLSTGLTCKMANQAEVYSCSVIESFDMSLQLKQFIHGNHFCDIWL